jgi:hypothetical protein
MKEIAISFCYEAMLPFNDIWVSTDSTNSGDWHRAQL